MPRTDGIGRPVGALSLITTVFAVAGLAACTGDDTGNDDQPAATEQAPDTTRPALLYETIPPDATSDERSPFIESVLEDDNVTADELDAAFENYVACLDDAGAYGAYAWDVELRTGLAIDWAVNPDDPAAPDVDVLGARCSQLYLGELTRRYNAANPPDETLADEQRESVRTCLDAVSPTAAANLPDDMSVNTAGAGASVSELQLDVTGLLGDEPSEAEIAAVNACIASLGAEWHEFGDAPAAPATTG